MEEKRKEGGGENTYIRFVMGTGLMQLLSPVKEHWGDCYLDI